MDYRGERRLKPLLKWMLRIVPFSRRSYEKGYLLALTRRQCSVNWFFKAIFHANADFPWSVHYASRVKVPERISIGEMVERSLMFSGGCYIQCENGIEIRDGVIFAPSNKIISANHDKRNLKTWCEEQPIRIGKDCWIGANAIILPGIQLGDGAVGKRDVPSGVTVVRNPARIVPAADSARDMGI
jgi:acetyltransferase-like isoleucine patch superfamily enzyme